MPTGFEHTLRNPDLSKNLPNPFFNTTSKELERIWKMDDDFDKLKKTKEFL